MITKKDVTELCRQLTKLTSTPYSYRYARGLYGYDYDLYIDGSPFCSYSLEALYNFLVDQLSYESHARS